MLFARVFRWRGDRVSGRRGSRPHARFVKDRRAATAVEFALVAAPFLGLLFVTIETCYIAFVESVLEDATISAARQLMTGRSNNFASSSQFLALDVCPKLSVFLSCGSITIQVHQLLAGAYTTVPNAGGRLTPIPVPPLFCSGMAGSLTLMDMAYTLPVITSYLPNLAGGTTRQIVAHHYYKNEPTARQGAIC